MSPFLIRTGLLTLLLGSFPAAAVDRMPAHDHPLPPEGLHLNQGQRWETNAALRQGMGSIRDAVVGAVHANAPGPLSPAEAGKLADVIHAQTNYLVAYCVLAPEADAVLHALLGELLAGAEALRANPADEAALHRIVQALKDYPVYFDHAGWKPVTSSAPAP